MPPWEGADAGAAGSSPAGGTADCGAPPCAQAGDLPRRKCRWSQACFTLPLAGAQEMEVRQSNVDSGSACLLLLAADRQPGQTGVRRKSAPPLAGEKNSGKLGRHRHAVAVVYVGIQVAARLTGQTFRSKRRSSAVPAGGICRRSSVGRTGGHTFPCAPVRVRPAAQDWREVAMLKITGAWDFPGMDHNSFPTRQRARGGAFRIAGRKETRNGQTEKIYRPGAGPGSERLL